MYMKSGQNECGNFASSRNQSKNLIAVSVFWRKTVEKHCDGVFKIFPSFFYCTLLSETIIAFLEGPSILCLGIIITPRLQSSSDLRLKFRTAQCLLYMT